MAQRNAIAAQHTAEVQSQRATAMQSANATLAVTIAASNAKLKNEYGLATDATQKAVAAKHDAVRGRGTLFLENGTAALRRGRRFRGAPGRGVSRQARRSGAVGLAAQAAEKVETRVATAHVARGQSVLVVASSPNASASLVRDGRHVGDTLLWDFDGRQVAGPPHQSDAITALAFDPSERSS